ncbi:MAG: calcium-binding protein [Pseudomonadota bacterium]
MQLGFTDTEGDAITTGNDSILGNGGDDTIFGDAGDDTIDAGEGDDVVQGGSGADSLDGGADTDTLSYADASSQVVASLATGSGQIFGDTGADTVVNFENLIGTDFADVLAGDSADNVIEGGDGADALSGGGGNDTLHGQEGNDQLFAQANATTLVATYDGGEGDDTLEADGALFSLRASTITDIETLNFGASDIDVTVELTVG